MFVALSNGLNKQSAHSEQCLCVCLIYSDTYPVLTGAPYKSCVLPLPYSIVVINAVPEINQIVSVYFSLKHTKLPTFSSF